MSRPLLVSVLLAAALTGALASSGASAGLLRSSFAPDDHAAAPPDFRSCTECHDSAALNSGTGSLEILGVPAVYVPGQSYTLEVAIADPQASRWGFELTALNDALTAAGSLASTGPNTQVSASGGREFVKHTSTGTRLGTTGGVSFFFDWTAPAAGTGTVRFYAAGNASNANFSSSGDLIYTTATASAEFATADATVTAQPRDVEVQAGDVWTVDARVRDHTTATNQVLLVSRVRLPNGNIFPSTGFLFSPITVDLVPAGQESVQLDHVIPASAPSMTASYEMIIGRAPNSLVELDSFAFTIL